MVISLFVFVINKRSTESIWLSGLFIGFIMANIGLMFFYAKMGGLIEKEHVIFFLTPSIQQYAQRAIITIDNIARLLTFGRALFLYFLLIFSFFLSGFLQKYPNSILLATLLPLAHSITTDPINLYKLTNSQRDLWNFLGLLYMLLYLLVSIILMVREYFDNTIRWVKKQLRSIIIFVGNLIVYFVTFCQVNPMGLMYSYRYSFFDIGFKVFRLRFSITAWYVLLGLFTFFIITGLFALFRYAGITKEENNENIFLARQMDTANLGTHVFIHGIKNQLFSQKITLRNLSQMIDSNSVDIDKAKRNIKDLNSINEGMTSRIEKLHQMFQNNVMSLIPCYISEIVNTSIRKISNELNKIEYSIEIEKDSLILADKHYLSEAVYNVLNNSINAIESSVNSKKGRINIILKAERRWCAIRIEDNGVGINKEKLKKVFDPFYTNKNSNYNWGIGLSYVKHIVKIHFGKIHLESKEGVGTVFIIALPIYKPPRKSRFKLKMS